MRYIKCLIGIMAMLAVTFSVYAKKEDDAFIQTYEIEGVSRSVSDGASIVKVTMLVKNKDKVNHNALGRAAVHGVLFKGYSNPKGAPHRPLCGSPTAETTYAEFFEPFFNGSSYSGYVQCMDETRRVVKVGKEYRVSCNVVVSESMLRQDLTKAGIINSLDSGW